MEPLILHDYNLLNNKYLIILYSFRCQCNKHDSCLWESTQHQMLDILYVWRTKCHQCISLPFQSYLEWALERIDQWLTLYVTESWFEVFKLRLMFSRGRSARQSWRNGPIRCTRSLRPRRWRPTCLTWTAFCPISPTPCSPWHKSHVPGPVTDVTVSSQHIQSDFQPWLCTGLKCNIKWLTVFKNKERQLLACELHDEFKLCIFHFYA